MRPEEGVGGLRGGVPLPGHRGPGGKALGLRGEVGEDVPEHGAEAAGEGGPPHVHAVPGAPVEDDIHLQRHRGVQRQAQARGKEAGHHELGGERRHRDHGVLRPFSDMTDRQKEEVGMVE